MKIVVDPLMSMVVVNSYCILLCLNLLAVSINISISEGKCLRQGIEPFHDSLHRILHNLEDIICFEARV